MKFVFFLDALDYSDLPEGWLKDQSYQYTPNVPRVTPNVISQAMTGKERGETGFLRSTPYNKPRKMGIDGHTILHDCTNKGLKVMQYGIPLCANIKLPQGSVTTFDHFLGRQQVPPVLQMAKARGCSKDDQDNVFNAFVDEAVITFATIRNIARSGKFDVFFIGFTALDMMTHNYNEKNRRGLISVIEAELMQTAKDMKAEILFFSDHGSLKKDGEFHINQWLKEQGWLDYEINYKVYDQKKAERKSKREIGDILQLQSPFTYINWDKTKFYCADAFDCVLDKTDKATDADIVDLTEQLLATGHIVKVEVIDDLIVCEPRQGLETTCNIHKDADKKPDDIRTGWHSKRATFGCTQKLETKVTEPKDIYDAMKEFIKDVKPMDQKEESVAEIEADLEALGYI